MRSEQNPSTDERDRCQFCLGYKGGLPGEELIIGGAFLCLECAELHEALMANLQPGSKDLEDADEVGALVVSTSTKAAELLKQEESGDLVSLVTPHGGTVTDADEQIMYRRLAEMNVTVCAKCSNTGWMMEPYIFCECPYGDFLAKKIKHAGR